LGAQFKCQPTQGRDLSAGYLNVRLCNLEPSCSSTTIARKGKSELAMGLLIGNQIEDFVSGHRIKTASFGLSISTARALEGWSCPDRECHFAGKSFGRAALTSFVPIDVQSFAQRDGASVSGKIQAAAYVKRRRSQKDYEVAP